MTFQIHPQLKNDCFQLGHLENCVVLLHKNAQFPWIILVPETNGEDLLDLEQPQLINITLLSKKIASFIKSYFKKPKINFASIGNVVPQLHIHIIGRDNNDALWPKPVWGHPVDTAEYSDQDITKLTSSLSTTLQLKTPNEE
jgi:diadenosine tetraphosphate (Ap4A) HIT family hydrolase